MERNDVLAAARAMLATRTEALAAVLRAQPHLDIPIGGGSVWAVREAAVHLAALTNLYAEIAAGTPSPLASIDVDAAARINAELIADLAETDPGKVVELMTTAVREFLARTQGWRADLLTPWHTGLQLELADLTVILATEALLHGYDVTAALGAPWPVDPTEAMLTLGSYVPLIPFFVNPETAAGHTGAYGVTVRGGPALTIRFTDGALSIEGPGGPVDCELSVDPVAFLLVLTGRLSRWPAIALGLFSAPEPTPSWRRASRACSSTPEPGRRPDGPSPPPGTGPHPAARSRCFR